MNIFKRLLGLVTGNAKDVLAGADKILEGKGTTRLRVDNVAESWLTQSIRPLIALWVLTLVTLVMFNPDIIPREMAAMSFAMLDDVIKFYFVARSSEKIIKMITQLFLTK